MSFLVAQNLSLQFGGLKAVDQVNFAVEKGEIFTIIGELNRDGTTIFLVEQNAHMALTVAHQFFLMEQGRITFRGTPGQLAEDEVIQRAYLGTRRAAG